MTTVYTVVTVGVDGPNRDITSVGTEVLPDATRYFGELVAWLYDRGCSAVSWIVYGE